MRPIGGLRGAGVWTARAGAANANLRNVDRRVGLGASGCSRGLAGMIGHARRVSRHVTVKIVTLWLAQVLGVASMSPARQIPSSLATLQLLSHGGYRGRLQLARRRAWYNSLLHNGRRLTRAAAGRCPVARARGRAHRPISSPAQSGST